MQIRIDIDPALAKAVEDIAGQTGQPFSALVNEALRRTLPQLHPPRLGRIQGWLENDDPFFKIMDRIESERRAIQLRSSDRWQNWNSAPKMPLRRVILRRRCGGWDSPMPPDDLMISATALARNLTLVTRNTRHFANVRDLKLEN